MLSQRFPCRKFAIVSSRFRIVPLPTSARFFPTSSSFGAAT